MSIGSVKIAVSDKICAKCPQDLKKNVNTGLSYFSETCKPQIGLFYDISENSSGDVIIKSREKGFLGLLKSLFSHKNSCAVFDAEERGPGLGIQMYYSFSKMYNELSTMKNTKH